MENGKHKHEWHKRSKRITSGTVIGFVCKCKEVRYIEYIPDVPRFSQRFLKKS